MKLLFRATRCYSSLCRPVAIIGSGPSGLYTAAHLLSRLPDCKIHIFEAGFSPFGLIRSGVAPDHQDIKCKFLGNVQFPRDISLDDLKTHYSASVLAYGSSKDKRLNIKGEDSPGVLGAKQFVAWYNGQCNGTNTSISLQDIETVAVIGHGNVALDVARILLKPVEELQHLDIPEYAVKELSRSNVKRVRIIGRRGPLQMSFTTAEMRQMFKLVKSGHFAFKTQEDLVREAVKCEDLSKNRPLRRLVELVASNITDKAPSCHRTWQLDFLRSPVEIINANGRVSGLKLVRNILEQGKAHATSDYEDISCELVIRSIGYENVNLDSSLPWDDNRNIICNVNGKVESHKKIYTAGWLKRGPVGVIAATMEDAKETAEMIVQEVSGESLVPEPPIEELLNRRDVGCIDYTKWKKIDNYERIQGQKKGKLREKFIDKQQVLEFLH